MELVGCQHLICPMTFLPTCVTVCSLDGLLRAGACTADLVAFCYSGSGSVQHKFKSVGEGTARNLASSSKGSYMHAPALDRIRLSLFLISSHACRLSLSLISSHACATALDSIKLSCL